jgi:hypothetical protein
MPTGAVFNWLTVAHSALEILDHAAQYRAMQVTRVRGTTSYVSYSQRHPFNVHDSEREAKHVDEQASPAGNPLTGTSPPTYIQPSYLPHTNESWPRLPQVAIVLAAAPAPLELNLKNSKLTPYPTNAESKPSATDPLALEADVCSLERDMSSSPRLPPSGPGATPFNVHLNSHSGVLFYLKF